MALCSLKTAQRSNYGSTLNLVKKQGFLPIQMRAFAQKKEVAPPKFNPIAECQENEYQEVAWGLKNLGDKMTPFYINRPKCGDYDVKFEVHFCGVCHSDLTFGYNWLGGATFPLVPGHEFAGKVVEVGSKVTKFKIGDNVGNGVISDSCLKCKSCDDGEEQYCLVGKNVATYNDRKRYTHIGGNPDASTYGGYSGSQVLHEHFIMKIPDGIPLDQAGPLLCAGITMYDPLRYHGFTTGEPKTVGIIGIGGLGTMGLKIANAMGHKVVAISNTQNQHDMSIEKGAHVFIDQTNTDHMAANEMSIDILLNTVPVAHELAHFLPLLKYNGKIVQLGLVDDAHTLSHLPLLRKRLSITGSHLGGIGATQDCLEFCDKHRILPDTEQITADQLDWAWGKMHPNTDGVRYVLDVKKSLENKDFMP